MSRAPRIVRPPLRLLDLTPDPQNANRGTARGRSALARSLREYGAGRGVVIDRHGRIIVGNKTVEQAKRLGLPLRVVKTDGQHLIALQRDDLDLATDPRARALAVADNRVAQLDLDWDGDMLTQLQAGGLDLSPFWTEGEFAARFADPTAGLPDENAIVEPGPTDIVRGDLLLLGRHRLLCGDATVASDVDCLLAGAQPMLMVTELPAGRSADPSGHQIHAQPQPGVGPVGHDDRPSWAAAWQLFPGCVAYVWHAGLQAASVAADLEATGFTLRSQIIWQTPRGSGHRGDYRWAHEPAWYAVRGTGHWRGTRRHTTVWDVPVLTLPNGSRAADTGLAAHGAPKPVRLYEIPILNHTTAGEALYDPFCGRGTAIIAAEKLGRACYAMDIDPPSVQAAITRWEAFTGQPAVCLRRRDSRDWRSR